MQFQKIPAHNKADTSQICGIHSMLFNPPCWMESTTLHALPTPLSPSPPPPSPLIPNISPLPLPHPFLPSPPSLSLCNGHTRAVRTRAMLCIVKFIGITARTLLSLYVLLIACVVRVRVWALVFLFFLFCFVIFIHSLAMTHSHVSM